VGGVWAWAVFGREAFCVLRWHITFSRVSVLGGSVLQTCQRPTRAP
jgi:hypothetical protein